MGLLLFFLPNFPGAMFIQGATFIPDSRVSHSLEYELFCLSSGKEKNSINYSSIATFEGIFFFNFSWTKEIS